MARALHIIIKEIHSMSSTCPRIGKTWAQKDFLSEKYAPSKQHCRITVTRALLLWMKNLWQKCSFSNTLTSSTWYKPPCLAENTSMFVCNVSSLFYILTQWFHLSSGTSYLFFILGRLRMTCTTGSQNQLAFNLRTMTKPTVTFEHPV